MGEPTSPPRGGSRTFTFVVLLASLGIFGVLAEGVHAGGAVIRLDHQVTSRMTELTTAQPAVVSCFGLLTQLGDVPANTLLALVVGAVLVFRRQRRLAMVALLLALGAGLLNFGLKELFNRPRPTAPTSWVTETNPSFPSGHSLGSVVCYGLFVYLLLLPFIRRQRTRRAVVAAVATLVLLIGFSRIYLRAHYLSDVVAGIAAGTAWLVVCVGILDLLRPREMPQEAPCLTEPARPAVLSPDR